MDKRNSRTRFELHSRRHWALGGLCLLAVLSATGCQQGYRWDISGDVAKAQERAREQGKTLFIFYQFWLDSNSGRMKGPELLSDPKVEAEFKDTVNVLIDRDFGAASIGYLRNYKVNTYPAYVLVAPDGKYKSLIGVVQRDQFLEWVRDFKARATQPAKPDDKKAASK
jgi:hypothetical protein